MKKLALTLLAFGALTFAGYSQPARKSAPAQQQHAGSPEERAEKQAANATKKLGLNDTQRAKFKDLSLARIKANKPLREQMKTAKDQATKDNLDKQIKANNETFFAGVKAMLTPEQLPKWEETRKEIEAKHADHKE